MCIYVVEEPHIYATLDMGPVPIPSVDELTRSAEKRMANFASAHLKALGNVTTKVLVGRPAEEVVNYAKEQERRADHHDDPRLQRRQARAPRQHHRGRPAPRHLPGAVDPQ